MAAADRGLLGDAHRDSWSGLCRTLAEWWPDCLSQRRHCSPRASSHQRSTRGGAPTGGDSDCQRASASPRQVNKTRIGLARSARCPGSSDMPTVSTARYRQSARQTRFAVVPWSVAGDCMTESSFRARFRFSACTRISSHSMAKPRPGIRLSGSLAYHLRPAGVFCPSFPRPSPTWYPFARFWSPACLDRLDPGPISPTFTWWFRAVSPTAARSIVT